MKKAPILFLLCLAAASCGLGPAKFEPKSAPVKSHASDDQNEIKVVVEVLSDGSAVLDGKTYRVPEDVVKFRDVVTSKRGVSERYPVGVRATREVEMEHVQAVVDTLKGIDGVIIGLQYDRLQRAG